MIEVFKTNVREAAEATRLSALLNGRFPGSRIHFDLEDCDRVLRVEGAGICPAQVILLVKEAGFECSDLE